MKFNTYSSSSGLSNTGYLITITTIGEINIFTRLKQKYIIIDCLKHYQETKGLELYAYCIMPNQIHLLCKAEEGHGLEEILEEFKIDTSEQILGVIKEYQDEQHHCVLSCFNMALIEPVKIWQNGYKAEIADISWLIKQKIAFIHNSPVREKIVSNPEDYVFSSARNYANLLTNELDVVVLGIL